MVSTIFNCSALATTKLLIVAQQQDAASKTLPEPVRQVAYMALLGIALLGMLIVVGILLGGHWVRRLGDRTRRRAVPPDVIIRRPDQQSTPHVPEGTSNDGDTVGPDETMVS